MDLELMGLNPGSLYILLWRIRGPTYHVIIWNLLFFSSVTNHSLKKSAPSGHSYYLNPINMLKVNSPVPCALSLSLDKRTVALSKQLQNSACLTRSWMQWIKKDIANWMCELGCTLLTPEGVKTGGSEQSFPSRHWLQSYGTNRSRLDRRMEFFSSAQL
jgi:hypothetical protein